MKLLFKLIFSLALLAGFSMFTLYSILVAFAAAQDHDYFYE